MPESAAAPIASFGALDWGVLVLYLMVMTAVGLWARLGQTSKRDFFLGGRDLPWWVVGLSIVATETSALTFIGIPAAAFGGLAYDEATRTFSVSGGNMHWMMLMSGYVLGRVIIAWRIIPLYFKGEVYTPYQLLSRAFGQRARYTGSILQLIGISLGAGVRVYVTAIPIFVIGQTIAPGWTIWHSILLIIIVALAYTAMGGIKAVVWTEMIQYFIYVGGGLFALFYIPSLLHGDLAAPNGAEGWAAVASVSKEHMEWFNLGFAGDTIGARFKDLFGGPYNLWMGLIPGTLGIVLAFGFDQLNVQRLLGCRDMKDSRKAMLMSAAMIVPQFLLFLLIGVALYAYYKINGFNFGVDPWKPSEPGKPVSDYVFPIFIVTKIPTVLKGFMIAAILAAAMSSVSAALSAMGSMITMDIYRPLRGALADAKAEMTLSRIMTGVSALALGLVAWAASFGSEVISLAFTLAGLTGGGILGVFAYGMIHKKGHEAPVIAGLLVSLTFMLALNLGMNPSLLPGVEAEALIWKIQWPWHPMIGMIVCMATIYALRPFFTTPEGRDIGDAEGEE
ncbi:MAG: solute:Na+ symporter, family [Candidatus Sumerlaeota bacterium]|nr:solute:Na+ symporter, family [Candidatus Sumerlaeota bacterium]